MMAEHSRLCSSMSIILDAPVPPAKALFISIYGKIFLGYTKSDDQIQL